MHASTTIEGQGNLPRYFSRAFAMARTLDHGRLDFVLPDGRRFRVEGARSGPIAEIEIHNSALFGRLIREGDLGFCDAYLDGWWSTPDLQAFMDLIANGNDAIYDGFPGRRIVRAYERMRFRLQSNSKGQARRNISHHYDLGNAFYGLWLDETMTYSSAMFETGRESLEVAQTQKYASMVDQMGVAPGDHVLEIGCGWGGFAEYAARERGLRVTGLTISREQYDYAIERVARAGLSDKVEIRMRDYRDEQGTFDGIASIEMFEAVGQRYWPVYFNAIHERLRPGRFATLQIITVDDRRWDVYRRGPDFIQKYIFPGGMLPSPTVLRGEIGRAGLEIARSIEFGQSYSKTLRRWYERFNERWEDAAAMGFDERFHRMWNFYLTACAASFRSGNCDVTQITVQKPA
ncbi:cyclopropane-fatty-acyl-phospholipid synthase family protein [Palleronia sp. LCG004]|uniref:cyclopropane-fatty-acyl-phospholipid synthase family protein n=1 Tax=Palleronia sp. LCG004 TaxID=3079304 RepID=UPI00294378CF|nr:cyclopropane-fatty-acyl-phospholipid synthase family protein [Palleronia sp. LCG004]WOI55087.1 cyclopropane-fatty-acyl-phospholipid synthase family protein [Palleronia sp. LCG004]